MSALRQFAVCMPDICVIANADVCGFKHESMFVLCGDICDKIV